MSDGGVDGELVVAWRMDRTWSWRSTPEGQHLIRCWGDKAIRWFVHGQRGDSEYLGKIMLMLDWMPFSFYFYMLLLTNEDQWIWEGNVWPLVVRTWQSSHIHFLQVLGLQDADGEFASGGDVTQRDANVTQLLRLWANKYQRGSLTAWLRESTQHLSRTTHLHMQKKCNMDFKIDRDGLFVFSRIDFNVAAVISGFLSPRL